MMVYQFHPIPHSSPFTKKTLNLLESPVHGILRSMDSRLCWVVRCWRGRRKSAYVQAVKIEGESSTDMGKSLMQSAFSRLVAIFCSLKKIPNIENPTKIEVSFPAQKKNPLTIHIYILIHFYNHPIISEATPPTLNFQDEVLHWGKYIYILYSLVCLLPFLMECRRYFYNFQGVSQVFPGFPRLIYNSRFFLERFPGDNFPTISKGAPVK